MVITGINLGAAAEKQEGRSVLRVWSQQSLDSAAERLSNGAEVCCWMRAGQLGSSQM